MKRYILAAVISTSILISPVFAQAAGLTSGQISAVIQLLQSFGADQSVLSSVQATLSGTVGASTAPDGSNGRTPQVGGTISPMPDGRGFCHSFDSDLTVGTNGENVASLNQALSASGISTEGNPDTFDTNVKSDVILFQKKFGLPPTGFVGPMTRGRLNMMYKCPGPMPSSAFSAYPTTGGAPLPVTFVSTVQKGTIDFGDGVTGALGNCSITASYPSTARCTATHTYSAPGVYVAALTSQDSAQPQSCGTGTATDSPNCITGAIRKIAITVTSAGTTGLAPSISSLSPSSGPVGTLVTINGTGFSAASNIYFNGRLVESQDNSAGTAPSAIMFRIPSTIGPSCEKGMMCPMYATMLISPGNYNIQVWNTGGKSNTLTFTVTN